MIKTTDTGKNILVIDDDTSILEGFKELLEKEGYEVYAATNEKEALSSLRERRYRVVLTDIVLKETTGIELIPKIQELSEGTAIVMITAYPSTESAIQCFRAGAFDYLIKPVKKSDLLRAVERGKNVKKEEQEINSLVRLKEAADKANREKTLFLAQVSHDIRTIMDNLIGHNNLLLKTSIDEKQAEYISAIKTGCSFLKNLADNILDIARVEAGKLNLKEEDFELAGVIKDVAKIIYPSIKEKPIQFLYEIEKDVPRFLSGDADRLRQILLNLVSNAVKFTEEGEIRLKVKLMTIIGRGCHVFFVVKDTGPGIPKERQMEIFKPFFEVDKTKKNPHPAAGLGLWICKVLVEKMGGLISLHSESGKGSEFRFSIRFNLTKDTPTPVRELI